MRKFVFQKLDGRLRPIGPGASEYAEWVHTLGDKECFTAKFTAVSSTKTHEQLGYYYAGIIPDVIAGLRELGWDEVGYKTLLDTRVPLGLTVENVDELLKTVYAISRGVDVPSKAKMSKDTMSDFIETILGWCQSNGIAVHPPEGHY